MANKFIERLYDIADTKNDQGMSKFDEQKLRKALEGNNKLLSRNKKAFEENEPKFHSCNLYDPCPLCDKCRNKASHLYVRCQTCEIPICVHTHKDKEKMLKRNNFSAKVSDETYNIISEISKGVPKNE